MTGAVLLGAAMAAEMAEQPRVLAGLVERAPLIAEAVRAVTPDGGFAGVTIAARGSSDHAATTGRYLLSMACRVPVGLAAPSLLTLYDVPIDFTGQLMVGVSQSGRTPEIVTVLRRARARGAVTVAITNEAGSPLAEAADAVLVLHAGAERAVPATKTATAQVLAFALLARALGPVPFTAAELAALPGQVAGVLADETPADAVAARLAGRDRLVVAARGLLHGAAQEVALKLQETTALGATAFAAADLLHGPIGMITSGWPALLLATGGPVLPGMAELAAALRERGADLITAGPGPATAMLGHGSPGSGSLGSGSLGSGSPEPGASLPWPADVPEALAHVPAVVRGQQLALALARRLGVDPDQPAGLSKVTST